VHVGVDESRHHELAGGVDDPRVCGDRDGAARSESGDSPVAYQDHRVGDWRAAVTVDEGAAADGDDRGLRDESRHGGREREHEQCEGRESGGG
jgi:hypothetical protein